MNNINTRNKKFECVEIANLILTVVNAVSAVISAIAAITEKNEISKLRNSVKRKDPKKIVVKYNV